MKNIIKNWLTVFLVLFMGSGVFTAGARTAMDWTQWGNSIVRVSSDCTVSTFPYVEGFETGLGCWTSNVVEGEYEWTTTDSYNGSDVPQGGYAAYFSTESYGVVTELVSPVFNLASIVNPTLTFYHIQQDWYGDLDELHIYYKTSADAEKVLLASYTESISDWTLEAITLPNPTSDYQIIFEAHTNYGYGIGLDNVKVQSVTCPIPNGLTVSAIMVNSANISWEGDAETYELKYKTTTTADWSAVTISDNPYTIEGLVPTTDYMLELRGVCGDNVLSNPATATFTTACAVETVFPYTESFESGLGCWLSEPVQNTYDWTTGTNVNSVYAPDGSNCAKYNPYGKNRSARLISPIFDISSLSNPQLSFAHIQPVWSADQDTLGLYYRTSADEEWIYITSWNTNIPAWQNEEIELPNPSSTYQIMFFAFSDYGYGVGIDNIVI